MNDRSAIPVRYERYGERSYGPPGAGGGAPEQEFSLLRVVREAFARKWLVIGITVLFVGITLVVVNSMTPIYRSTATVLVETTQNRVTSIDQIVNNVSANREFFATQAEFLKSREVTARMVRDQKLVDHPAFDPVVHQPTVVDEFVDQARLWIGQALETVIPEKKEAAVVGKVPEAVKALAEKEPELAPEEARIVRIVQQNLQIRPVRNSQLITVSFDSPNPELAAKVANAIAEAYIQSDLDARFDATEKASVWLGERLEQLRIKLDTAEANLQRLRDAAGVIRSPGTSSFTGSVQQMDTASARLVQARVARAQIEQVYRQVMPGAPNRYSVPQVFNNPSVVRAREVLSNAERTLSDVQQRLGTSHPEYLRAVTEHKAARDNWVAQSESVISSISKEFEVARSTEAAVKQEIESARVSIRDIDNKVLSLDSDEREVNTLRQLYQTFLARVKETSATSDFQSPVARVVDPAIESPGPIRPAKMQLLMVAAFLSTALGIALASILERLNRTVRSSDEVESLLNQPLLSAIPLQKDLDSGKLLTGLAERSTTLFGESVRTAVTGAQLSLLDVSSPIIGFTSSVPGEGKSTIAVSFALDIARRKRVLLIDADLRRPSVATMLGMDQSGPGLTDLLEGSITIDECIKLLPTVNLSVLRSGSHHKNPMDLLFSEEFDRIMTIARSRFDVVVVDTPPIELVSDALLIGRACSGMVYVVKSNSTEIPMIRRGLDRLNTANIRIIGVALNGHNFKKAAQYYGESSAHSQYRYNYGSDT